MTESVMGWHFTGPTLRDGRPIPVVGEWLIHAGPVVMCESGLHASRKALHALDYAPGLIVHRVECEDVVAEDSTKLVCRRRRIAGTVDGPVAEQILRRFARQCALSVIDKWDAPDIVRRYLVTGDESIRAAARDAAGEAAWAAAGDAARAAAWEAARDAAGDAAGEAARDAAGEAARDAAGEAARAAARDAARDAAGEAAWAAARAAARAAAWAAARAAARAAAWAAARAAAWDAYNEGLERMLLEAIR
jgi:hypothetical protein